MLKSYPKSESRIEKLIMVCFLLDFLFRRIVEIFYIIFRSHCIISASFQTSEFLLSTQASNQDRDKKIGYNTTNISPNSTYIPSTGSWNPKEPLQVYRISWIRNVWRRQKSPLFVLDSKITYSPFQTSLYYWLQ